MAKSPISLLQEIMQAKQKPLPDYVISPRADGFHCTVTVDGTHSEAVGINRKSAKESCARKALSFYGNHTEPLEPALLVDPVDKKSPTQTANWVGKLNEYCSQNEYQYPLYEDVIMEISKFIIRCTLLEYTTYGTGSNKKTAKQDAAEKMLSQMKANAPKVTPLPEPCLTMTPQKKAAKIEIDSDMHKFLVEKYAKLTISRNQPFPITTKTTNEHPIPLEQTCRLPQISVSGTEEQLKARIQQLGVKYIIEKFCDKPIMLTLKTENPSYTFIQQEVDRNTTTLNLLKQALECILVMARLNFK